MLLNPHHSPLPVSLPLSGRGDSVKNLEKQARERHTGQITLSYILV